MIKATKERYEAAARKAGWTYSPAHGGWVHDDERDQSKGEAGYVVQKDAADACWLHDIEIGA